MSDKIKITCPRCKHKWEKSLSELENLKTIYKDGGKEKGKKEIVKYRAICPNDGTYIILDVEED